jgi:hypothetical protein
MSSLPSDEVSSLQPEVIVECPLHLAMDELAHASVTQHVLYLEGECLPRPELLAKLDRLVSVHSLILNRICVATRSTPLEDCEFKSAVQSIRGAGEPRTHSERLVTACAICNHARRCPLGSHADQLS